MAVKSNPSKKATGDYEEKGTPDLGKVTMMDGGNVRVTLDSGIEILLTKEDLPKNVPFRAGKEYRVSVTPNKTNTKVIYMNPASGDFDLKFQRFSGPEDEAPAPVTKEGKWGPYSETYALLEIASGAWKGTIFPLKLSMKWLAKDEDNNLEVIGSTDYAQRWRDFFDATGVSSHPEMLKYSENPLPEIQDMAQEVNSTFKGVVVRGWVTTIYTNLPLEDEDNFPEPELSEAQKDNVTTHPALEE